MSRSARSPLEGTGRLVVDGTNLLYRLGAGGAAPPSAAIGRLRAAIPAEIEIELVFDGIGHGVTGRVAQGMVVRYAGRRPADDLVVDLVAEAATGAGGGPAAAARVLVVSNDRELRARVHGHGGRTVPLQWLVDRLGLPAASPSAGNRRAAIGAGSPAGRSVRGDEGADGTEDERPRWKPGRGATTKTGPARRVPRHRRHPRAGA